MIIHYTNSRDFMQLPVTFPSTSNVNRKQGRQKSYFPYLDFLPVPDTDNEAGDFFILFLVLSWFAHRTYMSLGVENNQVSFSSRFGGQVFLRHLPDPLLEYPRDIVLMIHFGLDNISPALIA